MDEEDESRMSRFFHWIKLGITSAPLIKGLIVITVSFLGLGTVTNPAVQERVMSLIESEPEVLPIPAGQVPTVPTVVGRDYSSFHAQVRQSLEAMKRAIENNKAGLKVIELDVDELEERREMESDANDLKLDGRLKDIEADMAIVKEFVN